MHERGKATRLQLLRAQLCRSVCFEGDSADLRLDKVELSEDEPLWWSSYYLAPNAPLPGWSVLEVPLPGFLQESELLFRSRYQEASDILYVQFRANRGEGLDEFLEQVRQELAAHEPHVLVIDQRRFLGVLDDVPAISHKLLASLASRIRVLDRQYFG